MRAFVRETFQKDLMEFERSRYRPPTLLWRKGDYDDDGQLVDEDFYLSWEDYLDLMYNIKVAGDIEAE